MPLYESVFIARQDIPAQEVEALAERFEGIVAEGGGSAAPREYWGLKNLAYRIKKNRKGHYTMLKLEAPAEAVHEMERNMRISEDVLRYLTIRVDALVEEPSAMLQARSSRDDRGRRGRPGDGPRSSESTQAKPAAEAAPAAEASPAPKAEPAEAAAEPVAETPIEETKEQET
jgi:small subunit ribosomal protein S6